MPYLTFATLIPVGSITGFYLFAHERFHIREDIVIGIVLPQFVKVISELF